MKANSPWPLPLSSELEIIKHQHLHRHFQQIATVAYKHYHYAFQIIKQLHQLPHAPSHKNTAIFNTLRQIIKRKQQFAFSLLLRRMQEKQDERCKASVLIAIFLQRKIIGISINFMLSLQQRQPKIPIPKFQHLFLIIKLSNLNKLLTYAKADAFRAIQNEQFARTSELRKAKIIKIGMILNNYVTRLKIDSFFSIKRPQRERQESGESGDDEQIFVESYKIMASNLNRVQNKPKSLQAMRREEALADIVSTLTARQQWLMRGCLTQLLCFENSRFTASTLAVLRREIAILEQEYESV